MDNKEIFAQVLSRLLKEHDLSQRKFASQLGLSVQAVSTWCNGKTYPECSMLIKIAQYFNVSTDYLLTGEKPENKSVREVLGLSDQACDCLKLAMTEKYSDIRNTINDILSHDNFYEAVKYCIENYRNGSYQNFSIHALLFMPLDAEKIKIDTLNIKQPPLDAEAT